MSSQKCEKTWNARNGLRKGSSWAQGQKATMTTQARPVTTRSDKRTKRPLHEASPLAIRTGSVGGDHGFSGSPV